jgi:glycopeptide antibiotics resistance protein
MLTFNKKHFYFTLLLFSIEVGITMFVHDGFIRPFIGDVLVVILIYCLVRTFCKIRSTPAAIAVLAFAWTIEILQSFNLVQILGLQNNKIMAVAIGSTFDWKDLLAYAIGTIVILLLENSSK